MLIEAIMTFQMHVIERHHSVIVTFGTLFEGQFEGIYTENNSLVIMERSVYVFVSADV